MSNSFGSGTDEPDQSHNGAGNSNAEPNRPDSERTAHNAAQTPPQRPRYSQPVQPPAGWGQPQPYQQPLAAQAPQAPQASQSPQSTSAYPTSDQSTVPYPQQHQQQPTQHREHSQQQPLSDEAFRQSQHSAAYGGAGTGGYDPQPTNQVSAPKKKKSGKAGVLMGGLVIGAVLGGLAGGGTAALVLANEDTVSTTSSPSGQIELKHTETSTAVSAIAQARTPGVVTLEVTGTAGQGSGSGVIYSQDGYIITNAHVVTLEGAAGDDPSIRARLSDGRLLPAKLVGVDPYADLAVVKVDADDLPAVNLADSSQVQVGDLTVAIGAPLNLSSTVTSGVISAVNRGITVGSAQVPDDGGDSDQPDQDSPFRFPWDFETPDNGQEQQQQQQQSAGGQVTLPVLQTDASINPGNSGGALLNGDGDLIGINVAIASTGSEETAGSVGLGFAVPSNLVKRVADDLIAGKTPSHGLLGASVGDASSSAEASHAGGLIAEVQPSSPAEKAGLKAGDVVTAIDGVSAADGTSVSALIRMHEGGSSVEITYSRDGKEHTVDVTLGTLEQ